MGGGEKERKNVVFHSVLVVKVPLKKLFDNAENITPGIADKKPHFVIFGLFFGCKLCSKNIILLL
mgnify:CR=1 FL=1